MRTCSFVLFLSLICPSSLTWGIDGNHVPVKNSNSEKQSLGVNQENEPRSSVTQSGYTNSLASTTPEANQKNTEKSDPLSVTTPALKNDTSIPIIDKTKNIENQGEAGTEAKAGTEDKAKIESEAKNPPKLNEPILTEETTEGAFWRIELTILEKGTGRPVGRAQVSVGDAKQFTNINGALTLQGKSGVFSVTLEKNGYETSTTEIDPKQTKELTFYLKPGSPSDNQVVVRGQKRPEVSKKILTITEASRAAPGGDAAQITKILPGVQSQVFGNQIAVRGSGPDDTIYQVDDVKLPFLFHPVGNISILPQQYLNQIEFSSGGYGPQYGLGTGGVVKLITNLEPPEVTKVNYTLNVPFLASFYSEKPIDQNRWLTFGMRKSTIEYIIPTALKKSNQPGLTVVPYFGDVILSFSDLSGGTLERVQYLYSQDGLKLAFPGATGSGEEGKNKFSVFQDYHAISYQNDFKLSEGWSLHIGPYTTYTRLNNQFNDNKIKLNICQIILNSEATKRLEGKNKLFFGVEPSYLRGLVDVDAIVFQNDPFFDPESAPRRAVEIGARYAGAAAWVGGEFFLGPWYLAPGIRGNWNGQMNKSIADPRLNIRYKLGDDIFKFAIGSYSQEPQPQELSKTYGNPNLAYIHSSHLIGGWERAVDDRWTIDLQIFQKKFTNLVKNFDGTYQNSGKRTSSGFETFIRREFTGRVFGWLSYTYSKARDIDYSGQIEHPSDFDQTHVFHLVGSYKWTSEWETGGRLDMNTGDVFTGIGDVIYNPNLDKYRANSKGIFNDRRLPDYKTLSIFAEKQTFYDTWKLLWRFGVDGFGIGKKAIRMQYNYDYSKEELFTAIPPIPYIELKAEL